MNMRKIIAVLLTLGLLLGMTPGMAESAHTNAAAFEQRLDASYTLALNAINAEDYETAKEYLNICFAYCDRESNPTLFADLLLKRACIDVIEGKNDLALLTLDAALAVKPDLADAYLVLTQVYSTLGQVDPAIENLEKYIELSGDTSLYETVAQLQEAKGNASAAQEAYDKYVAQAGDSAVEEAGFQSGLYKMQAGQLEEAIRDFEAYAENDTYGAGAMYNIGVCKMNLGDYEGAIAAFDSCQEKGGTFEGLYYNRGVCKLMNSSWESAAEDFTASIGSEPYVADATFNLGVCQMQTEQYGKAVATFTGLIGDGEAKADSEAEQNETGAQAQAGEAAENTVTDVVYYYRAVCNRELGNLEAALADFTLCIDHGYELSTTYYQRAQVYAALGDTAKQNSDLAESLKQAN